MKKYQYSEEKSDHYQIYYCLKVKPSFPEKLFQKEKYNYCYGIMASDFKFICGSVVGENCWLPASSETPAYNNISVYLPYSFEFVNRKVPGAIKSRMFLA